MTSLTGLIAILFYAFLLFLNSSFFADMIAQKYQEISGSTLKFKKNPKITLFPATISLEGLSLQGDKKELAINFSAKLLRLRFDLSSLLNDQIHIREIFVSEANLKILNKGAFSQNSSQKKPEKKQNNAVFEKLPFLLDRIVLQNSTVSYASSEFALWLSRMNLSAEHFGARQETDIKCDFFSSLGKASLGEAQAATAGNMAIRAKLRYYAPNLTFRQSSLTFTATRGQTLAALSPLSIEAEGSLNLNDLSLHLNSSQLKAAPFQLVLKGDYLSDKNIFDGHISLDYNPMPAMKTLEDGKDNTNYNIVLASPVQYAGKLLNFPDIAISSGTSKGSGNLQYKFASSGQAPKLQGNLAFCALNFLNKNKDEKNVLKTKNLQERKIGNENFVWPDIDISFSAPIINYDKFSAQDLHFQFLGKSGKYDLKNLHFLWASGKTDGIGHINMSDQILLLETSGKDLNIGRALWELGIDGFQDGVGNYQAKLAFSGFDSYTIKKSLAGDFSFSANHVKISLLTEIIKFLSRFSLKASSIIPNGIDLFSVKAHAENGKINLDPLLLESKVLTANAHGNIDLLSDEFNAQLSLNVFGMNLPIALGGQLSNPSWRIEPTWFKRFF